MATVVVVAAKERKSSYSENAQQRLMCYSTVCLTLEVGGVWWYVTAGVRGRVAAAFKEHKRADFKNGAATERHLRTPQGGWCHHHRLYIKDGWNFLVGNVEQTSETCSHDRVTIKQLPHLTECHLQKEDRTQGTKEQRKDGRKEGKKKTKRNKEMKEGRFWKHYSKHIFRRTFRKKFFFETFLKLV